MENLGQHFTPRHLLELTPRETQIMEQFLSGLRDKEVARALFISPETVKTHITRIKMKLGARTRMAAAAEFAFRLSKPKN